MIDALLVRAVNSFETIGVFAVLLSTRGCRNQEDQCVFQAEYGCMASMIESARCPSQSYELRRIPRAARSLSLQVAIGRKGRFRKGAAPATKGTVLRRRRLFEG